MSSTVKSMRLQIGVFGRTNSGKSSFSTAVSKAKEKKNSSFNNGGNFTKTSSSSSGGTSNFASSLARIKASSDKAKSAPSGNLASSLANIKKITTTPTKADGKIDYRQVNAQVVKKVKPQEEPQQKLSIAEMIAKAKQKASETKQTLENRSEGLFPIGTRVFHNQFGVGKILNIEDKNYVVEFTKAGQKTLDSTTSGLKMF